MYDWLEDALAENSSPLITANLRLSRELAEAWGRQLEARGVRAWETPQILVWKRWLHQLYDALGDQKVLPTRLNSLQSRLAWEQCLRHEVDAEVVNIQSLARLAFDTWNSMSDWALSPETCANAAVGQDQRIFARTAKRYSTLLAANNWVDDASLPDLLLAAAKNGDVPAPTRLTLAGFDRVTPLVRMFLDCFAALGTAIEVRQATAPTRVSLHACDDVEAELRAAGAWAAKELDAKPGRRVAIVVSGLESNAERYARLLREGLVPGWQFSKEHENALNVSYGRVLADFPAIYVALQLLRWVSGELRGADISGLLRSTHLGNEQPFGRSRAELRLRDIPDRNWSMARFLAAFRKNSCGEDFDDWLQALARLDERVAALPARTDPASWASHVVSLLAEMNWPGGGERNSADYQLENRWRELLNEFSTLGLVEKTMTLKVAVARIVALAAEAVFQPESEGAAVAVLGPLEAAGMEFDSLWVAGLGADDWPPPGRPTPLLSRDLQLANDMPDSSPQNTLEYARRVVARLQASASHCRISYAASVADREQLPSPLLQQLEADAAAPDPGWFADSLRAAGELKTLADDVPELREDELVSGGAATINRQYSEPFAAFAFGRLGVRWMQSFTSGIAPNVRGSIIHNALQHLYEQTPRAEEIAAWSANDVQGRVDAAINKAFYRSEKNADEVLLQLFRLERKRTAGLLAGVIAIDQQRSGFAIKSVENGIEGLIGPVRLSLRGDRIDVLDDASILILDYKTGTPKPFLTSGSPNDLQLVVYACSSDAEVGGLGLFNVDTREVAIDGAGPALRDDADWEASLSEWKDTVYQLAAELARGDVRINALQGGRDARPLHLLSRIAELTRAL